MPDQPLSGTEIVQILESVGAELHLPASQIMRVMESFNRHAQLVLFKRTLATDLAQCATVTCREES